MARFHRETKKKKQFVKERDKQTEIGTEGQIQSQLLTIMTPRL